MADDAIPHADVLNSTAQGQIRSILDRAERLIAEKAEIDAQLKEVFAEAKGNGFCPKTLKKVIRIRKMDRAKRQEEEAMLDLYLSAAGELPLFANAERLASNSQPERKGIATVTLTMEDGRAVAATPDQMGAALKMVHGSPEREALYEQAVELVRRDQKASTSYVQRRLQLNYNTAATLMERMEAAGVVGKPNHAGKREVLPAAATSEAA